jgi:hypothetical protein
MNHSGLDEPCVELKSRLFMTVKKIVAQKTAQLRSFKDSLSEKLTLTGIPPAYGSKRD